MFSNSFKCGMLFLTLSSSPAVFADNRAYVGLRMGGAMDSRFGKTANVEADSAVGLYIGWAVGDHWSVELGHSDLGESSESGVADAGFVVEGSLLSGGVHYRQSVGDHFDMFGGVGLFNLREDGTAITIVGPVPVNRDDRGAFAELGVRYRFDERFSLRASYQWFDFDTLMVDDSDGTPWLGMEIGF